MEALVLLGIVVALDLLACLGGNDSRDGFDQRQLEREVSRISAPGSS